MARDQRTEETRFRSLAEETTGVHITLRRTSSPETVNPCWPIEHVIPRGESPTTAARNYARASKVPLLLSVFKQTCDVFDIRFKASPTGSECPELDAGSQCRRPVRQTSAGPSQESRETFVAATSSFGTTARWLFIANSKSLQENSTIPGSSMAL